MQYGVAAAAVRDVVVADELVAAADRQWDIVRARVDAGGTPPLERDLLEVELRRFEAGRLLAAGRADVALVQLKQLLGMSPDEPLLLRETLEVLVTGSSAASVAPVAIATRPDVREAEARVALADARVDQAQREGRLDVSLFGTYMRMDAGFPQQGVGSTGALERVRGQFNYVALGAMVTLPLFNRAQGQVAAAQAERSGAEARREAAELAAHAEVAAAQARDARAQRAVGLYTGGMRTLARQNLSVVQQTFDLGRATVFDVLAEQRRYLEVEQAYTTALREAWEARAALKRALGEMK
jgi:cobalt-zinc-cadmium efflux system outer membrane protein